MFVTMTFVYTKLKCIMKRFFIKSIKLEDKAEHDLTII